MRYRAATVREWPLVALQSRRLSLIWALFVVKALFFASTMPLWEGFDEFSHFEYIDHLATTGQLPSTATAALSEVSASLKLAPTPYKLDAGAASHDDYWKLPESARDLRQRELLAVAPSGRDAQRQIYEAQQPPLYYVLMAAPYRMLARTHLFTRVWSLRILAVLTVSLIVPLSFMLGKAVLGSEAFGVMAAALLALLPELYITAARISNEALAIPLGAAVLVALVHGRAAAGGIALGAALLTKAYFLALIPAALLARRAGRAVAVALLIGGGWYVRNMVVTRSLSGEQHDAQLSRNPARLLELTGEVEWLRALDSTFVSHVWMGGWSFIGVRSWMYHFCALLAIIAFAGLLRRLRERPLLLLATCYAAFCAALAYHVIATFAVHRISATTGWYLYALAAGEVVLLIAGMQAYGRRAAPILLSVTAFALAALELFAVHVYLLPYYAGLIAHTDTGKLPAYRVLHDFDAATLFTRLAINKPVWSSPALLLAMWLLYLASCVALLVIFLRALKRAASH